MFSLSRFYLYHKITREVTLGQAGQPLNWGTVRTISVADNIYIFFDTPVSLALKANPIIKNRVTPFCVFIKLYPE